MVIGIGWAMLGIVGGAMVGYLAGAMAHGVSKESEAERLRTVYYEGLCAGMYAYKQLGEEALHTGAYSHKGEYRWRVVGETPHYSPTDGPGDEREG